MRQNRPLIQCETDVVSVQYHPSDMLQAPSVSHSRESSASTTSDSSPVTPTFSARSQSRYSSTNSSASSLPPLTYDLTDGSTAHKKNVAVLPGLAEEPVEREGQMDHLHSADVFGSSSPPQWNQNRMGWVPAAFFTSHVEYDMRDGFSSDGELSSDHNMKRRKSGDSSVNSFATRIVSRFPSLSKHSRDRKKLVNLTADKAIGTSSPMTTLSRSSSFARSFRTRSRVLSSSVVVQETPVAIASIAEDEPVHADVSSMDDSYDDDEGGRPDPLIRASTPLLPPLMVDMPDKAFVQSPLQSPTVASSAGFRSLTSTPTPGGTGLASPALLSTPSRGTVQGSSATPSPSPSELLPILIADPNDEWAEKLGHANFDISPHPYMPKHCTLASCKRLLLDWEFARAEYSKHLARTSTHFGPNSKTYKLTEQKWATIDAQWRRNNDLASIRAVRDGETPPGHTPIEPAPVSKIPTLDVSLNDGKFPKLGDDDIVGPMVQVASQSQLKRKPSKSAKFLSMIGLRSDRW